MKQTDDLVRPNTPVTPEILEMLDKIGAPREWSEAFMFPPHVKVASYEQFAILQYVLTKNIKLKVLTATDENGAQVVCMGGFGDDNIRILLEIADVQGLRCPCCGSKDYGLTPSEPELPASLIIQ